MGTIRIGFDKGGELEERHLFKEVDLEKAVVVEGEGGTHVVATVEASVAKGAK